MSDLRAISWEQEPAVSADQVGQYLALVFRTSDRLLFSHEGRLGHIPFTFRLNRGMPLPPTTGFDHFNTWVDNILQQLGFDAARGIQVHFHPDSVTLRPLADISFFTAIAVVDEAAFKRLKDRSEGAAELTANEVMNRVNSNMFFPAIMNTGYTIQR